MSAQDEARRLLAAITPGPWLAKFEEDYPSRTGQWLLESDDGCIGYIGPWVALIDEARGDAEFIAAAPTLVAGLLVELAEAQARNERLTAQLENAQQAIDDYQRHEDTT